MFYFIKKNNWLCCHFAAHNSFYNESASFYAIFSHSAGMWAAGAEEATPIDITITDATVACIMKAWKICFYTLFGSCVAYKSFCNESWSFCAIFSLVGQISHTLKIMLIGQIWKIFASFRTFTVKFAPYKWHCGGKFDTFFSIFISNSHLGNNTTAANLTLFGVFRN